MEFIEYYKDILGDVELIHDGVINKKEIYGKMKYFNEPVIMDITDVDDTFATIKNGFKNGDAIYIFRAKKDFKISSVEDFNRAPNGAQIKYTKETSLDIKKYDILYVGKAKSLSSRFSTHLGSSKSTKGLVLKTPERNAYKTKMDIIVIGFNDKFKTITDDDDIYEKLRELAESHIRYRFNVLIGK